MAMAVYNASNAECLVYAFKEGLLSQAAHDLELRVERFEIQVDDVSHAIVASFDPNSLRLKNAYAAGGTEPEQLAEREVRKIHNHIVDDVLQTRAFPELRFVSSSVEAADEGFRVMGAVTLHGVTRELRADVQAQGERWVAEVSIEQPDFGIKPFRAVFGTIRIKPGVQVRVSVPRT
jgi:hypothetical protein